jgi:hypothetical protein
MWGAIESSTDVSMLHHIVTKIVFLTVVVEVEQLRHVLGGTSRVARIRESGVGVSQLVEEGVDHGFNGGQTLCRRVFEELGDKIDGTWVGLAEDL